MRINLNGSADHDIRLILAIVKDSCIFVNNLYNMS